MTEPTSPQFRTRASHGDRDRITETLSLAYADGRLDAEEFEERSTAAGTARFLDELDHLVTDLQVPEFSRATLAPYTAPLPARVDPTAHGSGWSIGIMGGQERSGTWTVAPHHNGLFIMGGGSIDLREAVFTSAEVVITITAIMGGCSIVVTPDTEVICSGIGIMGAFGSDAAEVEANPSRPRVRVRGLALMGGCAIVRREVGEPVD